MIKKDVMMHKRKKSGRYRGSKTHGCGSMKKRRGKGNKGGAGRAGSFKRGDQKRPSYWKERSGNFGFKPKGVKPEIRAIKIVDLHKLISKGLLKEEKGIYDLGKLGYNKLLGGGKVGGLKIKVCKASKKVIESVKKAGGEVVLESGKEKQEE